MNNLKKRLDVIESEFSTLYKRVSSLGKQYKDSHYLYTIAVNIGQSQLLLISGAVLDELEGLNEHR